MRFAATIAYNGAPFAGFQRQNNGSPTVQGTIEAVLGPFAKAARLPIIGAGRTDAGVHASGQVIAFDLGWQQPVETLQRALNASLPKSIAVTAVWRAATDFHPRYDARARRYVYRLYAQPIRDPLRSVMEWHHREDLDLATMQQAAQHLLGSHDFRAFGRPPQGNNALRTVMQADWQQVGPGSYTFTVQANAFLYRMVRRLVGSLTDVGCGRLTVEEFAALVTESQGGVSLTLAPPHGLTLVNVDY